MRLENKSAETLTPQWRDGMSLRKSVLVAACLAALGLAIPQGMAFAWWNQPEVRWIVTVNAFNERGMNIQIPGGPSARIFRDIWASSSDAAAAEGERRVRARLPNAASIIGSARQAQCDNPAARCRC